MNSTAQIKPWQRLEGLVAPVILRAPKTCVDLNANGEWSELHESLVGYLERNVAGSPWMNHLTLAALIMTARRRQANTIRCVLSTLHPRLTDWFRELQLGTMADFDATVVFQRYLGRDLLVSHSNSKRGDAWKQYTATSNLVFEWLESLPADVKEVYSPFCLPVPDYNVVRGLDKLRARIQDEAKETRKKETDAVVPGLHYMRAIAQLRLNRVTRMRQACQDAVSMVQKHATALPFSFSYEEGEDKQAGIPPKERLYFRLWDRRSFLEAHIEHYGEESRKAYRNKMGSYSVENDRLFLEFVRSEPLIGDAEPEGLWFADLLRYGLLGNGPTYGSEEEIEKKTGLPACLGI